jgi:hypothetical protein
MPHGLPHAIHSIALGVHIAKGAGLKVELVKRESKFLTVLQVVALCPDVTLVIVEGSNHDRFIPVSDDGVYETPTRIINVIVVHITPKRLNREKQ